MKRTNEIFYFDEKLKEYEINFDWDDALAYLENIYLSTKSLQSINSLIGFSWYYLIEGGVESGKYEKDDCKSALTLWKKYIDIGQKIFHEDPYFNFIAGYTLSLHGFYIEQAYENKGIPLLKKSLFLSQSLLFNQLLKHILENKKTKKYVPLKNANSICDIFFDGESLLEKYFCEILRRKII